MNKEDPLRPRDPTLMYIASVIIITFILVYGVELL